MRNQVMMLLLAGLLLTGCGGSDEPAKVMPVEETVFSTQVQALEKAKAVEQVMENAAQQQRQAIDNP